MLSNLDRLLPPSTKKIIVAPLNWGLGHVTRSMPVIDRLLAMGKEVVLASDGLALQVLKRRYPQLEHVSLPSYNVQYSSPKLWKIILHNSYNVASAVLKERRVASKLVKYLHADMIISDSRFGFRSSKCHSVIISHQVNLKVWKGIAGTIVDAVNRSLINAFDQCWIPDDKDVQLAGELSYPIHINRYVNLGIYSRLKPIKQTPKADIAIILSGPEPARTKLEVELIRVIGQKLITVTVIRGTDKLVNTKFPTEWQVINIGDEKMISHTISLSRIIIGRSGYTSLMDYYCLSKSAIIIPTPGQAEQEYLGTHLNNKFGFKVINERELDQLPEIIEELLS